MESKPLGQVVLRDHHCGIGVNGSTTACHAVGIGSNPLCRSEREMMTNDEISRAVTRGTTNRPEQVRVMYNDGKVALVKWPGGRDGCALFHSWVSPWVTIYKLDGKLGFQGERQVWDSDKDKDGRLTPKRLVTLVEKLGLNPEYIQ